MEGVNLIGVVDGKIHNKVGVEIRDRDPEEELLFVSLPCRRCSSKKLTTCLVVGCEKDDEQGGWEKEHNVQK